MVLWEWILTNNPWIVTKWARDLSFKGMDCNNSVLYSMIKSYRDSSTTGVNF